jgi:hypothetical protein
MIKFELNGKAGDLGDALQRAFVETAAEAMRENLMAIRHPDTGEFPTITAHGAELHDLRWTVEGSPGLLEIVRQQLSAEDLAVIDMQPLHVGAPRAFLSFAWPDKVLAEKIAHALQAKGIDTWWAPWSTMAGDSLPTDINKGLERVTHFVVLLTPASWQSKWVQQEMDAVLVQKLAAKVRFIPIRYNLAADALPSLPNAGGFLDRGT